MVIQTNDADDLEELCQQINKHFGKLKQPNKAASYVNQIKMIQRGELHTDADFNAKRQSKDKRRYKNLPENLILSNTPSIQQLDVDLF